MKFVVNLQLYAVKTTISDGKYSNNWSLWVTLWRLVFIEEKKIKIQRSNFCNMNILFELKK